jgi:hypothetical protein
MAGLHAVWLLSQNRDNTHRGVERKRLLSAAIADGFRLRKLLHKPEKLFRLEDRMQRWVSGNFAGVNSSDPAAVNSDETSTLTGIPFPNSSGQFQTFASVWTVLLKMLHIGENNVVRPAVVEGKGFFIGL